MSKYFQWSTQRRKLKVRKLICTELLVCRKFSACKTGSGPLARVSSDPNSVVASLSGCHPFCAYYNVSVVEVLTAPNSSGDTSGMVMSLAPGYGPLRLVINIHTVLTNNSALRRIKIMCIPSLSMAYQFFTNSRRPFTSAYILQPELQAIPVAAAFHVRV